MTRADKIVVSKEFTDQFLTVKDGKIYCQSCAKFIKYKRLVLVRQHCFGTQVIYYSLYHDIVIKEKWIDLYNNIAFGCF